VKENLFEPNISPMSYMLCGVESTNKCLWFDAELYIAEAMEYTKNALPFEGGAFLFHLHLSLFSRDMFVFYF